MGFRWQGVVFASDPFARIGFEVTPANAKDWHGFNPFFSVQDRNLLVTQKWAPVPPNPGSAMPAYLRVYFSPTLDEVQEEDGWVFVKDGVAETAWLELAYIIDRFHNGKLTVAVSDMMPYWNENEYVLERRRTDDAIILRVLRVNQDGDG